MGKYLKLIKNKDKTEDKIKNINSGLQKELNFELFFVESSIDIYNDIAITMANKLKENNLKGIPTTFILPVGPKGQYTRFARICNNEKISCKNLITINMDEFLKDDKSYISMRNPLSFRRFMKENLFDLLNHELSINPKNVFFPNPKNLDEINDLITQLKDVDICFVGAGINGHIAFNEPISKGNITLTDFKNLKTRVVELSKETITTTALKVGGYIENIPKKAITIGLKEILKSKEIKLYLEHNHQAAILERILSNEISQEFPITLIKLHHKISITASNNVLIYYGKSIFNKKQVTYITTN